MSLGQILRDKMVERGEPVMTSEELDRYRLSDFAGRVSQLFEFQKRCGEYPAKDGRYCRDSMFDSVFNDRDFTKKGKK